MTKDIKKKKFRVQDEGQYDKQHWIRFKLCYNSGKEALHRTLVRSATIEDAGGVAGSDSSVVAFCSDLVCEDKDGQSIVRSVAVFAILITLRKRHCLRRVPHIAMQSSVR